MVGASGLFGAVLYQLVESPSTVLTWRLYTLWSVVHITIIASVLGHACDAAGSTLGVRLAYGAGVVGAVLVAVALPIDIGHAVIHPHPDHPGAPVVSTVLQATSPEQEAPQAEALDDAWFDAVEHRLAQIPAGEPVVIVAASGGGSRAALYATLTLEALERTPPHGTVEQWTEREAGPSIADQVLFITSVSGGSVAASHFRFAAEPDPVVHSPHNTVPGELAFHFGHEVQRLCARQKAACTTEAAELGHQEGRGCTIYGRLCQTPDDPDAVRKADQGFDLAAFREHPSDPPWPLGSARFDAIATDFNAPLLRGMVLPGMERGESMTLFWRTHFGW